MTFKFLRFFYHYYQTPTTMNPFVIAPPQSHRHCRAEGLPVVSIVDADDEAAVQAVARVLRYSAGDTASTRAQFTTAAHHRKGAEFQRRLKELQKTFVRDVRAMGFDGWLYKVTTLDGRGGGAVVGGAFLERVDAGCK